MAERRSIHFERRSRLYARYDAQLCLHTRFFAAASTINAVLAKCFAVLPSVRSPQSFHFLNEAGAALEVENLSYARAIQARRPGPRLDQVLVCGEQGRLQHYVDAHRTERPQQWKSVRSEINGLLNDRYAAPLLSNWCAETGRLCRVLREARANLGKDLDFADQSHRILIGLRLIERIRLERWRPHLRAFMYITA